MKYCIFSTITHHCFLPICVAQHFPNSDNSLHFEQYNYSEETQFIPANVAIQDHQGFMWFGTEWGLYRYDGYTSDHYSVATESLPSLYTMK